MNISKWILGIAGWRVDVSVLDYSKCIICVAPHTSNWDFILGKLAYASVGRKAGFLMKEAWFFFPMGCLFRAIGGIPVSRKRGASLVDTIVRRFNSCERLHLAITPEGTRSRVARWRTGFIHISLQAHVPCVLGVIDYKYRSIFIKETFTPSGDVDNDMKTIKEYYRQFNGKYPDKFTTED